MVEVLRGNPGEVEIRVTGIDANLASQLKRCVGEARTAERVVIDLVRVGVLRDVDVGAMAKALRGLPRLAIRGLGRHQLRLLRYCGVNVGGGERAIEIEEERT